MVDDNELNRLRDAAVPAPGESAKARAFEAAMRACWHSGDSHFGSCCESDAS
jgi:hypothetical protein